MRNRRLHSPETRAKISVALKRAWANPETRAKISAAMRGRKCSAETRAKMSAAMRGRFAATAVPPELRGYYKKLRRCGYSRAEALAVCRGQQVPAQ